MINYLNLAMFECVVKGSSRELDINSLVKCGDCTGTGAKKGTVKAICGQCHGTGVTAQQQGFFTVQAACTKWYIPSLHFTAIPLESYLLGLELITSRIHVYPFYAVT